MTTLLCRLFHRLSWPHRDSQGGYQVCLEDGRRVPLKDAALDGDRQITGPHHRIEGLGLRVEGPALADLRRESRRLIPTASEISRALTAIENDAAPRARLESEMDSNG